MQNTVATRSPAHDFTLGGLRTAQLGMLVLWSLGCLGLTHWGDGRWQYDRSAVLVGEWWRLLSAHWMHLNLLHALGNVVGGWVLLLIFAPVLSVQRVALVWLWSTIGVSLGLWFLYPDIQWYVGASGALHGLWAAGALLMWSRDKVFAMLALLAVTVKCWWEWQSGHSVGHWYLEGATVVTEAHRCGLVAGIAIALPLMWLDRKLRQDA